MFHSNGQNALASTYLAASASPTMPPMAVGGSDRGVRIPTISGGDRAAEMYTLIQTVWLNDIDP
jgi:hypothetical protein